MRATGFASGLTFCLTAFLAVFSLPAHAESGGLLSSDAGEVDEVTQDEGGLWESWGQFNFIEGSVGLSLESEDLYATASAFVLRSIVIGPLGVEVQMLEWIRPGGAPHRDRSTFGALYLHVVPWVSRKEPTTWKDTPRVSVLDFYAGGSAWAFRSDNDPPEDPEGQDDGMDWGHQYFRTGVRFVSCGGYRSFALDYGVIVSPPAAGSDVDEFSQYAAIHVGFGYVY